MLKVVGSSQAGSTNKFTTDDWVPNTILEGGSEVNSLTASGGNNVLIGGSGTNTLNASGGTETLLGGAGKNTFNFIAAGNFNVVGGVAEHVNADQEPTDPGRSGPNTYNFTGAGYYVVSGGPGENDFDINAGGTSYYVYGGGGVNNLVVSCQGSGDDVYLSQQIGSDFEVTGTINGNSLRIWASGLEDFSSPSLDSITLKGSSSGSDVSLGL